MSDHDLRLESNFTEHGSGRTSLAKPVRARNEAWCSIAGKTTKGRVVGNFVTRILAFV